MENDNALEIAAASPEKKRRTGAFYLNDDTIIVTIQHKK
jgi:hypothetical protein